MAETENPSPETTIEVREELMISPLGGQTTLRTAHFLKPSSASIEVDDPPPYPLSSTNPTVSGIEPLLKVSFGGRRYRQERWASWVHQLLPKYHHIWKKSGIYEAILSSTYQIMRRTKLLFPLAERWNPETNTFVFPWGESTLTLEDMRVLGGYSALGYPVITGCPEEFMEIERRLCLVARRNVRKGREFQGSWMKYFMGSGHILEHEAFIALWLARYVLPSSYEIDSKKIFPLAIHLSRGTPIALAPAVLASIYRDLSLLKESITSSFNLIELGQGYSTRLHLWAPFQLVMIWVWERFPMLRPDPNLIQPGDPRSARWHGLKDDFMVDNVGAILDSARDCFNWRPYSTVLNNWIFSEGSEGWVVVEPEMDTELVSFVLCIRVSELVGLDCVEQYLPHRVAMQFGFDQDVPGDVIPRFNHSFEAAWSDYIRPITDMELYIPPRLFESDVTDRYFSWRTDCDGIKNAIVPRQPRSSSKKRVPRICWRNDSEARTVPGSPVDDEEDSLRIAGFYSRKKKAKRGGYVSSDDDEPHSVVDSPDLQMVRYKEMKDLYQTSPSNSINPEKLRDGGFAHGLNRCVRATNKNGEVEKLRAEFEARFTRIERVIAQLKREIRACKH